MLNWMYGYRVVNPLVADVPVVHQGEAILSEVNQLLAIYTNHPIPGSLEGFASYPAPALQGIITHGVTLNGLLQKAEGNAIDEKVTQTFNEQRGKISNAQRNIKNARFTQYFGSVMGGIGSIASAMGGGLGSVSDFNKNQDETGSGKVIAGGLLMIASGIGSYVAYKTGLRNVMTGQEDTKVALEAMHGQLGILQRVLQKQQNEPAWKLYDLCETLKDELNTLKAGKEEPVIKLINDILVQVANLKVILSPHTMDAYFTGDGVRAIQDAAEEISRLADELHEADDTGVEAILVLSSQILDNGSIIEPSLAAASLSM